MIQIKFQSRNCFSVYIYYRPNSVSALDPIELCSVLTDAMDNKELDSRDEKGRSPLHLAAMRGATICCIHLLQVTKYL